MYPPEKLENNFNYCNIWLLQFLKYCLYKKWLNIRKYFDIGPIAKKGARFFPWTESYLLCKEWEIQIFCSWEKFGEFFVGNGTNVIAPSEIKLCTFI